MPKTQLFRTLYLVGINDPWSIRNYYTFHKTCPESDYCIEIADTELPWVPNSRFLGPDSNKYNRLCTIDYCPDIITQKNTLAEIQKVLNIMQSTVDPSSIVTMLSSNFIC